MRKFSILYLDNTFTFGGAINSLCYLIKALNQKLYHPVLVTAQPISVMKVKFSTFTWYSLDMKLPWAHNTLFKKITSIPIFRNKFLFKTATGLRFLYWLVFNIIPEAYQYYRIGKRHDVGIVHLNNLFSTQLSGIIASKMLQVPCVAHMRDFEKSTFMIRRYAGMVDHHIAVSSAVRESVLRLGVPEERVSLIHDAIDLEEFDTSVLTDHLYREFGLSENEKRFGIFGRMVEWKGIREFILAAHEVLKGVPEAKAFIVGDSSDGAEAYFTEMIGLVKELHIEDRVIFTGYRSDVPNLMKLMDVIVHASIRPEPFGMVIIEGMAMGKPVVATTSGGPLDIVVEGETGFLVAPKDTGGMADAITILLKDSVLSERLGTQGRQRVEQLFTSHKYAQETEKVYEFLLGA